MAKIQVDDVITLLSHQSVMPPARFGHWASAVAPEKAHCGTLRGLGIGLVTDLLQ
jgi:hypothetical protein